MIGTTQNGIGPLPLRASRWGGEQANKTYASGRVCKQEGCGTILSMYNAAARCWEHEPRRPVPLTLVGRKRKSRLAAPAAPDFFRAAESVG
jgi:hypothetical protein